MKYYFVVISFLLLLTSCGNKHKVIDNLSRKTYHLVNQNNQPAKFPNLAKGKLAIVGYIFTNCPDICPLTTNNMRLIQARLKKEKINNVQFVSISFDPQQDKPEVLKKFAEIRNLDLSNWTFLTGPKATIDSLMNRIGIMAVVGDSTVFKDGRKIYYYVHTDRIQLFDTEGKILYNYKGSNVNIDEVVEDIKSLK